MSGRVLTLPSGATALLRDPEQVSERLRRPILARSPQIAELAKNRDIAALREMSDIVILAFVASWSIRDEHDQVLPVTVDAILDLPGNDYDAIEAAATELLPRLFPNFSDVDADPESPTAA